MKKKLILILFIVIVLGLALYMERNEIYKYIYPKKYSEYVEFYAEEYNLDENLVYSVIKAESKFDKDAVSIQKLTKYESNNWMRLITGILFGFSAVYLLLSSFVYVFMWGYHKGQSMV